jgi:hypothetical protein
MPPYSPVAVKNCRNYGYGAMLRAHLSRGQLWIVLTVMLIKGGITVQYSFYLFIWRFGSVFYHLCSFTEFAVEL